MRASPGAGAAVPRAVTRGRARSPAHLLALAAAVAVGLGAIVLPHAGLSPSAMDAVAARVTPAVVSVRAELSWMAPAEAGTGAILTSSPACETLTATGIVIDPSGEVLTNNHVVQGASALSVRDSATGRSYRARVLGTDMTDDIALLQVEGATGLATITAGDSRSLAPGDAVLAIGAADADGAPSVAGGRVTGLGGSLVATNLVNGVSERLTDLIETSVPLRPGYSGGPLVDLHGRVVGMNTAEGTGASCAAGTNRGVAIPIEKALGVARLIESGRGSATVHVGPAGSLGVEAVDSTSFPSSIAPGAFVTDVRAGSPAGRAGITRGDVIVSLGAARVGSPADLIGLLQRLHPGDRVRVGWVDLAGATHTAALRLATGPPQ